MMKKNILWPMLCLCMFNFFVLDCHCQYSGFYPSAVKQLKFVSQGQNLSMDYIYEKSNKPRKRTVLLLHGKNFNMQYWDSTMVALMNMGFDVVAVDQIGFGKSSMPHNYQYSFQQLAINTKVLLDSLYVNKVILLGHSMGGMLAMRFAMMYPDNVERMFLESPIGLEDWKKFVPYSSIDSEYKKEKLKTPETMKNYMADNYFNGTWKTAYDSLLNIFRYHYTTDMDQYAWSQTLSGDMIFTQPVLYELDKISVPVMLIIGLNDKTAIGKERVEQEVADALGNYKLLGKNAAAAIADCQLVELEGIGHIPHIENFNLFFEKLLRELNVTQEKPERQRQSQK